jgi:poly(3-hydroxybutyrate) depolymerase
MHAMMHYFLPRAAASLCLATLLFPSEVTVYAEQHPVSPSLPSEVCSKALPANTTIGQPQNISITSSGVLRSYLLVIPPLYTAQASSPVIFSFHGGNRDAIDQLELDELTSPFFNNNSIVVYPQGINVRIILLYSNYSYMIDAIYTDTYQL